MGIFSNNVIKEVGVGEWNYTWTYDDKHIDKSYLEIKSLNGQHIYRFPATSHTYGYLLESANQERYEQLEGFITLVYCVSMCMTQDQGLCDDVTKAVKKWHRRIEKQAIKEAKSVTDAQLQADEALIDDIIAESNMTKRELADKRAGDKEILKDILSEKE